MDANTQQMWIAHLSRLQLYVFSLYLFLHATFRDDTRVVENIHEASVHAGYFRLDNKEEHKIAVYLAINLPQEICFQVLSVVSRNTLSLATFFPTSSQYSTVLLHKEAVSSGNNLI